MDIEKAVLYALRETDFPEYDPLTNPLGVIPVIVNGDQPEPRAPYLLINTINTMKVGMPYKSVVHSEFETKEHIFQVKEYFIRLTLHAKPKDISHEWFKHFESGSESDMYLWSFTNQGLGLVTTGDILYQPQPVNGTAYRRGIIDLTLRAEVQDSFDVYSLEKVTIEGELSGKVFTFFSNSYPVSFIPLAGQLLETLVNNFLPENME